MERNFIIPITNIMKDCYVNYEDIYANLKKTCSEAENEYSNLVDSQSKYYKITKQLIDEEKDLKSKMIEFDQGIL